MKRRILSGLLLVSLTVLLCAGCSIKSIEHGTEITDSQMSKIIDGKTTKQDIFVEFGNPSKTMDNEKVFFFNWTRGSKNSFMGIGGGSAYTHSLVIVFDDTGVVKNHKITRGATEAGVNVTD
jgi:outer membrane protein assembly factor BamE (lipoprotein component of BamABCDE complex)